MWPHRFKINGYESAGTAVSNLSITLWNVLLTVAKSLEMLRSLTPGHENLYPLCCWLPLKKCQSQWCQPVLLNDSITISPSDPVLIYAVFILSLVHSLFYLVLDTVQQICATEMWHHLHVVMLYTNICLGSDVGLRTSTPCYIPLYILPLALLEQNSLKDVHANFGSLNKHLTLMWMVGNQMNGKEYCII